MTTSSADKFRELLDDFKVAILVTRSAEGSLRGRPMALAEAEPDGTLWFVTDRDSAKVDELERDDQVAVTMQSGSKYISLSGRATPIEDSQKLAGLWQPQWKLWFPGGKEDPDLLLLKIDGNRGEYWDNSGTSGLKFLIEAGKALATGTRPDVGEDPKLHAKVSL